MTVRRWDPWSEMLTLREAMGRLLEDSYVRPATGGATGITTADVLMLDVYEDADNVEVDASLPGLNPDDVEITIQSDVLTIKGQRRAQTERKQGNYLMREQRFGNVFRAIQLPVQVDADKARAHFEHGVLHLTLPKAAATKPRQIRITGGGQTINQQPQAQIGEGKAQGPQNGQAETAQAGATGSANK